MTKKIFFSQLLLTVISLWSTACSSVFYQGDQRRYLDPRDDHWEYDDIFFQSKDDTRLHAWVFRPVPEWRGGFRGTVVQFHGNAQNISSHFTSLVWLTELGYQLFTFDYRGYGKSAGRSTPEGVHEDGLAALDKALSIHRERQGGVLPSLTKPVFVVIGQSLGGAVASRALADWKDRAEVDLLVLDSTFPSYQAVAAQKLRQSWLTWLFHPLAWILISDRYAPLPHLKAIQTPALLIHDRRDPIVPFEQGQLFAQELPGVLDFWDYSKNSHIAYFSSGPEQRERFIQLADQISKNKK